jgi:enolase
MPRIERLSGLEILDSRGRPTVRASCWLAGGASGTASVPSGASTGTAEALELRDGDLSRYAGLGCRVAVGHITGEIQQALRGHDFADQPALDLALVDLDGTRDRSRLGANAILAVSLAFARAAAAERGVPLHRHFADLIGHTPAALPRPTINLFSGGKHAGGQVPIQDVLVIPLTARGMHEVLSTTYAIYQAAAALGWEKYRARPLRADEGGLAPPFADAETMLEDAVEAIARAGYEPGRDVGLAVDVASSQFHSPHGYRLGDRLLDGAEMVETLAGWIERFPIVSLEDGLAEEDWSHWAELKRAVGGRVLVMGDDLLCTQPARVRRAIEAGAANALLLKVNQVGTVSDAAEAFTLARAAGWHVTASARSGETEDSWLADLAVGWGADHIKIGSITQSERLAKYNRLLEIEEETGWSVG